MPNSAVCQFTAEAQLAAATSLTFAITPANPVGQALLARQPVFNSSTATSELILPLLAGDGFEGAVYFQANTATAFSSYNQSFLAALAQPLALALANARSFRMAEQRLHQLEAVHATTVDLVSHIEPAVLLELIVQRALNLLQSDSGGVFKVDSEAAQVECITAVGEYKNLYMGMRLNFGEGAVGRVGATGETLIVNDYLNWSGIASAFRSTPFGRVLAVPLCWKENIIGVLMLLRYSSGPAFTNSDARLIELFASQASAAVTIIGLYDQVVEQTRQLARRNNELETLEELKDDFLALVSHDLRGPLSSIQGYAQMTQEVLSNYNHLTDLEPALRASQIIARQSERLNKLVLDLLDMARLENGKLVLDKQELNLGLVVHEICDHLFETLPEQYKSAASPRLPRLVIDVEAGLPRVMLDLNRIEQVLTNLLTNAIKYSPVGSTVEVRVRRDVAANQLLIAIKDEGVGFTPEALSQLFHRFYRTEQARQGGYQGVGLGLYLSRLLVEAHGGKLWAESQGVNQGSTFYIALPL